MTDADYAVYVAPPKVAMSDDLPLGEVRRMWSPTASTLNRPHMQPSAHADSRGLGRSGARRVDHHVEQLSDLISEAQVGPSSTSMTAYRRTSQIVPSAPEAYYLPRGNGRYEPTRATAPAKVPEPRAANTDESEVTVVGSVASDSEAVLTHPRRKPHEGPLRVLVGKETFSENHAWSEMPHHWRSSLPSGGSAEAPGAVPPRPAVALPIATS